MRFDVQHVDAMPSDLREGVIYVSLEFETAHHLCACGCGRKVRTPLSPAEWSIVETPEGVTLHPSIGNWQFPCQSHYVIRKGQVIWAEQWSKGQVQAGRARDQRRLEAYLDAKTPKPSWWHRIVRLLRFGR
jgi:hypothetical protein